MVYVVLCVCCGGEKGGEEGGRKTRRDREGYAHKTAFREKRRMCV